MENFKRTANDLPKNPTKEKKKEEKLLQDIHKAIFQEFNDSWRGHVPVYGWIQMNYPKTLKPSLLFKYKTSEIEKKEIFNKEDLDIKEIPLQQKPLSKKVDSKTFEKNYFDDVNRRKYKHPDRLFPEKANEHVIKEIDNLINFDHTQKFMKNYKKTDLKYLQEEIANFENKNLRKLNLDSSVPENYSTLIEYFNRTNLFEFGYKAAYTFLSTDSFDKKCNYVDLKMFFGKKYCTMYQKSNVLGPEPEKNFIKKIKKIGDISFEEDSTENENVKNLLRLPPDNITEEWIKHNLNSNVELLRLENCYWLSKDLLSKLGRIDDKLLELSLRNLEISNFILTNVLKYAKNIEVLDISYCKGLTVGVCDIISMYGNKIKSLKLVSLKDVINDNALEYIGNIKSLNDLDIALCSLVTDNGLTKFCKGPIKTLESINLTANLKITNTGVKTLLSTYNNSLRKLTISQMYQKTIDGEICSEISKCKKINYLDISGCVNITNDALASLFTSLNEIENLNLSSLPVNDSTVESALLSNKRLKILRLSNCKDLTNNILDFFVSSNQNSVLLFEINRTKQITDQKIKDTLFKMGPNLRIIRATNLHWDLKDNGYRVPIMSKGYVKPFGKGAKKPAKKGDDPQTQYAKLMEQRKPRTTLDLNI